MPRHFQTYLTIVFSLLLVASPILSHAQNRTIIFDKAVETMLNESYIEATAYGYGKNRQAAKAAAIDGASTRILERVLGARVTSERTTSDGEALRNFITSQVEGKIAGHYVFKEEIYKFEMSTSSRDRYEAAITLRIPVDQPAAARRVVKTLRTWEKKKPIKRFRPNLDNINVRKIRSLEQRNEELIAEIDRLKKSSRSKDQGRIAELKDERELLEKEKNQLTALLHGKNCEIDTLKCEIDKLSKTNHPGGPYTGLIIDARGLGVETAMAPKIYTEVDDKLRQIYGVTNIPDSVWVQRGMVEYAKSVTEAQSMLGDRIGNQPLVVKAEKAYGSRFKTDVLVGHTDAVKIFESDLRDFFLEQGKVVFVID